MLQRAMGLKPIHPKSLLLSLFGLVLPCCLPLLPFLLLLTSLPQLTFLSPLTSLLPHTSLHTLLSTHFSLHIQPHLLTYTYTNMSHTPPLSPRFQSPARAIGSTEESSSKPKEEVGADNNAQAPDRTDSDSNLLSHLMQGDLRRYYPVRSPIASIQTISL